MSNREPEIADRVISSDEVLVTVARCADDLSVVFTHRPSGRQLGTLVLERLYAQDLRRVSIGQLRMMPVP